MFSGDTALVFCGKDYRQNGTDNELSYLEAREATGRNDAIKVTGVHFRVIHEEL
eukprot:m.296700 g.296700  ORF g.296700 m.296700 type:complete len:54 (+) comp72367_c0_seq1:351-512(+)